jgi:hypothetical protein
MTQAPPENSKIPLRIMEVVMCVKFGTAVGELHTLAKKTDKGTFDLRFILF